MKIPPWRSLSLIMLFVLLSGCLPAASPQPSPPWVYSDLRLLAAPVEALPSHQLVGLYTRSLPTVEQVRMDLFDFEAIPDFDLYLALDTSPGGVKELPIDIQADLEWDILLSIPASGPLQALTPTLTTLDELALRVVRNSSLDTVVVTFSSKLINSPYRIQVFLTSPSSRKVVSQLGPVRSDAWSPPRLPVLLAFWNTFPAYTPAQAMRRYDGAHTGPASDRHGLRGLLDAVEASGFPATLLDIKNPVFLSALDFAGGLPRLHALAARDLLILPDQLPLDAQPDSSYLASHWSRLQAAQHARQIALEYGLSPSPFMYTVDFPGDLTADLLQQAGSYRLVFSTHDPYESQPGTFASPGISINETATLPAGSLSPQISRWGAYSWVNIAPAAAGLYSSTQATYNGPALEIRRALLEAATSPQSGQMILLGGELAQTSWGNPQSAMQTLQYLKSRPWIQPVNQSYLNSLSSTETSITPQISDTLIETEQAYTLFDPLGEPLASGFSAQQIHDLLVDELRAAPDNEVTRLAWQAYEAIFAPPPFATPLLASLRAGYLGQIGHLLAAARWGDVGPLAFCEPAGASASCQATLDLDWDGEDEYLLLSTSTFALFEARGGYLSLAFVRDAGSLHQVVGPSTQFLVGMGDPLSWKPELGIAGDSAQLRGAFSDLPAGYAAPGWEQFFVSSSGDTLSFSSPDGKLRKSFHLIQEGMEVNYASSYPLTVQIPLVLDPSERFSPDWGNRYEAVTIPGGWSFNLAGGPRIQVITSEKLQTRSFSDLFDYMGQPEDPDLDYPPGFHLPFPIALVEVYAAGEFTIQLQVQITNP